MRLRPLVIALAGWTAIHGLSIAAETPSQPPGKAASGAPAGAQPENSDPLRTIYYAVMGEVAHPGTYQASASWTLAELVKQAGGITLRGDRAVRLFRGGVLTEQVYLGSGTDPSLLPGDLVVVGARKGPHIVAAIQAGQSANETETLFAVQLAFVNLIERPVIVKMPSDQATLPRIVELLGQSSDCLSKIRVFNPRGAAPGESEMSDQMARTLESGTVLVFPSSSIRTASLPALPPAIAVTSASVSKAVAAKLPEFKSTEANPPVQTGAVIPPLQHKVHLTIENDDVPQPSEPRTAQLKEIAPRVALESSLRPFGPSAPPVEVAVYRPTFVADQSDASPDRHPGRTVAIMAAMSAIAGAAMLLTIISIVQRWLNSGKAPFERIWSRNSKPTTQSTTAVIPIPPISTGSIARRPIRIDAGQPITRLSVDLAAIERVSHKKSIR